MSRGICPKCNGTNLRYGFHENFGHQTVYQSFTCNECGCEATEWFEVVYTKTEVDK